MTKMNKKGFTVLELILAFTLTTIVVVYLMQIISLVHAMYISNNQKTEALIKQSNIMDQIYRDLDEKTLRSISTCEPNCSTLTLTFTTGESKTISINNNQKIVKYGDYAVQYDSNMKIENIQTSNTTFKNDEGEVMGSNLYDAILQIKIPISINESSYDINAVYQYNTTLNNVTIG